MKIDIHYILGKLSDIKGKRCFNVDLAEKIGVTPQSISNWSNGQTKPTGDNVRKIAEAINETNINKLYK